VSYIWHPLVTVNGEKANRNSFFGYFKIFISVVDMMSWAHEQCHKHISLIFISKTCHTHQCGPH